VLELRGLTRRFGRVVALDGVSFSVPDGQLLGFVGPNGAGKTTTMRIILGVLDPDAGEVRWRGRPMTGEARRRAGYMPEERGLYPKMRVRDQLVYFARLHGLTLRSARESSEYWMDRLGVAARAGDRVEALSLGNQQRVQLAAALVHDPELLVLDEPFAGLDPVGVDALAAVLSERAAAGIPVLFSSHQLELVERLCDAAAIINRGRLVTSGLVADLRRAGGGRRYRVEVAGAGGAADAGWVERLPGVTLVRRDGPAVLVDLDDGTDDQWLLDRARATGRVTWFGRIEPSLGDLFRQAVQDPPAGSDGHAGEETAGPARGESRPVATTADNG
jgi:ABC-2 type transport system ATP-binding protein